MKKMKQYFLKKCNAIFMAFLGVLGFSSCDRMEYATPAYGVPHATFIVKGTVENKANDEPIEGIQVKFVRTFTDANDKEHTCYLKPKKLTDEEGNFKLKTGRLDDFLASDNFSVAIHFSDIDGAENGLFENKVVELLDIDDFEQTRPASGFRDRGEFTKTLNVQLTPKDEETDE